MWHELPVLIKASTSLILHFPPVIPSNRSYTLIHVSVCKDHPSKRAPRSSKICIRMFSVTCDNASVMAPKDHSSKILMRNQMVQNIYIYVCMYVHIYKDFLNREIYNQWILAIHGFICKPIEKEIWEHKIH